MRHLLKASRTLSQPFVTSKIEEGLLSFVYCIISEAIQGDLSLDESQQIGISRVQ